MGWGAPAGLTCLSSLPATRQDPDSSEEKSCFALPHPVDISEPPIPFISALVCSLVLAMGSPAPILLALQNVFPPYRMFLDSLVNKGRNFSFSIFLTQLRGKGLLARTMLRPASLSPAVWCRPVGRGHLGVNRWAILPEDLRAAVV